MKRFLIPALLLCVTTVSAQESDAKWRAATEKELRDAIPARVKVENERIETEFRTAAGISNGKGKVVAGVLMLVAGYHAEGKYNYFFLTKAGLKMGDLELKPGEYVIGDKRVDQETRTVTFYEASTGKEIGSVKSKLDPKKGPVRQFTITSPGAEAGIIKFGRFFFEYSITSQN